MDLILHQAFKTGLDPSSKHVTLADKRPVQIYFNRIQSRIKFKIKTRYYIEPLTPAARKLLQSTERRISKHKNGENVSQLEIADVALVHCNIVNSRYQHNSRVLSTIIPSKLFGQLLNISPTNHIYQGTFCSLFSYIEVWFTDENFMPL